MNKNDLISVVVPVYNVELYLRECVDSILSQKYVNFECILVDDGSTDSSGALCDVVAKTDSRIKVIHKKNGGLSSARNAGVEASKGNYVCFVDSDDMISEDYLRVLYENAVLYNADVSMCEFIRFWDGEKFAPLTENILSTMERKEFLERVMCSNSNTSLVISCNKLIRREIAEKISFPAGKWHEDEFYLNSLLKWAKSFVLSSSQLYFYRQRANSIMGEDNKKDPRHLVVAEAYKERKKLCRQIYSNRHYLSIITLRFVRKTKNKMRLLLKKIGISKFLKNK